VRKADAQKQPLEMAGAIMEARQRLISMIEASQAQVIVPEKWPVALGHAAWIEEV
jgi:hypothetical protein